MDGLEAKIAKRYWLREFDRSGLGVVEQVSKLAGLNRRPSLIVNASRDFPLIDHRIGNTTILPRQVSESSNFMRLFGIND